MEDKALALPSGESQEAGDGKKDVFPINDLPFEVLYHIFGLLPPLDAFTIYTVCILWKQLTLNNSQPWKTIANRYLVDCMNDKSHKV